MIEINLVPDVKQEYIRARLLRNFVVSVSIVIGAAVVGLAVVLGLVLGGQIVAENIQDGTINKELEVKGFVTFKRRYLKLWL